MHTDESINAYIIGQLLAGQPFHYDPQDRHGPALAAVTLPLVKLEGAKSFAGLTESQLRLSPVLAGTATVLLLGAGVEMFGFVACFVAALLFAFAPLPVYYNRYFIHESLFVAATLGLILSGWRTVRDKSVLYAALAGFCGALMLACKETAPLHFLALAIAAFGVRRHDCAFPLGDMSPSSKAGTCPRTPKKTFEFPAWKIILTGFLVFLFTTVLLFTWFGQNWRVFVDLFRAVPHLAARAGGEGHEKPFWYYVKLLCDGWSGGFILALAGLGIFLILFKRRGRSSGEPGFLPIDGGGQPQPSLHFFSVIYGIGIFIVYSLIPYKTPWLALNFWLMIALLAGMAVEWTWFATGKFSWRAVIVAGLIGLGFLMAHDTRKRVFVEPADENNPYAYAHTVEDLLGLPERIAALSQQENLAQPRIAVVAADAWPLPWYLRKYSQVGFWQPGQETGAADFYITSLEAAGIMGDRLTNNFNAEYFGLRPEVLIILWTPATIKKPL